MHNVALQLVKIASINPSVKNRCRKLVLANLSAGRRLYESSLELI